MDDFLLPPYIMEPVPDHLARQANTGDIRDWGWLFMDPTPFHEEGYKGQGVVVFVIDTGIDSDHEDAPQIIYRKNWTSDKTYDPNGHGSWCASRVASPENGVGVIGIAPECVVVDLHVLGENGGGNLYHVAEAWRLSADVQLAEPYNNWRRVVSASLGTNTDFPAVREAIQYASSKGVLSIAAAGNDGYKGTNTINYPARYDKYVLAVAATQSSEEIANYSSGGAEIDVAAPGSRLLGMFRGGYANLYGTSMATPGVAGAVALLLCKYGDMIKTQEDLERYFEQHATEAGQPGFDVRFGWGTVIVSQLTQPEKPKDKDPGHHGAWGWLFRIIEWIKKLFS